MRERLDDPSVRERLDDPSGQDRFDSPPLRIPLESPARTAAAGERGFSRLAGYPLVGWSRDAPQPGSRLRHSWQALGAAVSVLTLIMIVRAAGSRAIDDWLLAGLAVLVSGAVIVTWRLVDAQDAGRRAEADSFQRILSGLSRSVSPDAIVSAIVDELGAGTGADHIVVARRRPGGRLLEATLVATHSGLSVSQTVFPVTDLEDPEAAERASRAAIAAGRGRRLAALPIEADGATPSRLAPVPMGTIPAGHATRRIPEAHRIDPRHAPQAVPVRAGAPERIARRIADRVRDVYGLKYTLAAPLRIDGHVEGAIVLSRRTPGAWPERSRRLLGAAAVEASAALARAYSHRAAEARASTDALTGLPNRRYFDEYVQLLARRRRADDRVGVLMVDIDRFKMLNDTYGHAVGDHVLRAVAGAIAGTVREDDVPARFGGEEFVVLLRNPTPEVAYEVAERVRRAVGGLDLRGLGVPSVSVSVGVAVAVRPDVAMDALIAEADTALYRAKRAGRDRVVAA